MLADTGAAGHHRDVDQIQVPEAAQFGLALNGDIEGRPQLDGPGHPGRRRRLVCGVDRVCDIVGPRPPLPSEVAEYTDYDKQRLLVMPGCTGLWQVTRRSEADFDEMVWLDIVYINHSGLWEDLKLIIKTIGVVIHPNGAY